MSQEVTRSSRGIGRVAPVRAASTGRQQTEQPGVTGRPDGLLIKATWLVLFASFGWTQGFSDGTGDGLDRSQILFRMLPVVAAAALLVLREYQSQLTSIGAVFRAPLGLLFWPIVASLVANVFESGQPFRIWKAFEYATMLALLAAISQLEPSARRWYLRAALTVTFATSAFLIVQIAVWPGETLRPLDNGLQQAQSLYPPLPSNQLGVIAGAGLLLVLFAGGRMRSVLASNKLLWLGLIGFAFLAAQSRSALLALVVTAVIVTFVRPGGNASGTRTLALGFTFLLISLAALNYSQVLNLIDRGDQAQLLSANNRDVKFSNAMPLLRTGGVFGRGAGVSGRYEAAETVVANKDTFGQAHSAPLEVLLSFGAGGLLVTGAVLVGAKRAVRGIARSSPSTPWLVVFIYLSVAAITNSFVILFSPVSLLYLLALTEAWSARGGRHAPTPTEAPRRDPRRRPALGQST